MYNTEVFIKKAQKVYDGFYDYSLVDYKNSQSKVKIICPVHGVFEQRPAEHLRGRGCIKCGQERCGDKQKEYGKKTFVERCKAIHGDRYSYDKVNYIDSHTPIIVTCKVHGDFKTLPYRMLNGSGCNLCGKVSLHNLYKKGRDTFIKEAIKIHGDMFDYSLVDYYNNRKKIKIICKKHGIFEQTPSEHLRGIGCPKCVNSSGEAKIVHYLDTHNIEYKREYYIKNDTGYGSNKCFRVDFYIPQKNLFIEYNGPYHYVEISYYGGINRLKQQQERDNALREFCKTHDINLLEIPYNEYININTILDNNL